MFVIKIRKSGKTANGRKFPIKPVVITNSREVVDQYVAPAGYVVEVDTP